MDDIYEAWLAGKEIECRWKECEDPGWILYKNHPDWPPFYHQDFEFRVKPKFIAQTKLKEDLYDVIPSYIVTYNNKRIYLCDDLLLTFTKQGFLRKAVIVHDKL